LWRCASACSGLRSAAAARGSLVVSGTGSFGDELGLHDDPRRRAVRLDLEEDRRDRTLDERHEARRAHDHALPGRREPADLAAQHALAQVKRALVMLDGPVTQVERLVVDEQPQDLAVRDIDHRLAGLRIAVARFGVGQRAALVEAVEVRAGIARRLALVEVAAQADVAVGEREDRLGVGEQVELQSVLGDRPRVDPKDVFADHGPCRPHITSAGRREATAAERPSSPPAR
jgi:hypothetical protein